MAMATQWFVIFGYKTLADNEAICVTAELGTMPTLDDLHIALAREDGVSLIGDDYCVTGFTPITVEHAARFFAKRQYTTTK